MATQTFSYVTDATLLEIRTLVPAYVKKMSELIQQNRVLLPLFRRWGVLKMNRDISFAGEWTAKTELPAFRTWSDDVLPMWQPGPVPIKLNLGDGSYEADDKLTFMQMKRIDGNRTQIVNYYDEKSKDLTKTMANGFNFELLHGDGTGRRITGLDAVLTTGGTNVAADIVACPSTSVTYAGQKYRAGQIGGTWPATLTVKPNANLATDWPIIGNQTTYDAARTKYDALAPLTLNTTSTSWTAGATWLQNALQVMRFYISVQRQRGGLVADSQSPLTFLMGEKRLREAREVLDARNYALLPVQEAMDWGMPETLRFEGAWLTTDSDVGSDQCYCIQPEMLEYETPDEDLWKGMGPDAQILVLAFLYVYLAIGRLKINPKFVGQLKDVA